MIFKIYLLVRESKYAASINLFTGKFVSTNEVIHLRRKNVGIRGSKNNYLWLRKQSKKKPL